MPKPKTFLHLLPDAIFSSSFLFLVFFNLYFFIWKLPTPGSVEICRAGGKWDSILQWGERNSIVGPTYWKSKPLKMKTLHFSGMSPKFLSSKRRDLWRKNWGRILILEPSSVTFTASAASLQKDYPLNWGNLDPLQSTGLYTESTRL